MFVKARELGNGVAKCAFNHRPSYLISTSPSLKQISKTTEKSKLCGVLYQIAAPLYASPAAVALNGKPIELVKGRLVIGSSGRSGATLL